MTEREQIHQNALDEQDRLFKHYAHIRQKIYAALFVAFILIAWACLIKYNPVHIWYGLLVIPFTLFGLWLMFTPINYPWELSHDDEE